MDERCTKCGTALEVVKEPDFLTSTPLMSCPTCSAEFEDALKKIAEESADDLPMGQEICLLCGHICHCKNKETDK